MARIKLDFFTKRTISVFFNLPLLNNSFVDNLHYIYAKHQIGKYEASLPQNFIIETTNLCNAKCIMCGHKNMKREKCVIDAEVFREIVNDAKNCGIKRITLQGYGEPLLDRDIFDRIRFIKDKEIRVTFNTNGSLLDEQKSRLLIESGIDEVYISLDAFSKESFERIRFPLIYETVKANIVRLWEMRNSMGLKSPRIILTFAAHDENEAEARPFYDYWKDGCDEVVIGYARNWADQVDVKSRRSPHIHNNHRRDYNPCDMLWTTFYVQCNGRVALCCDDYEGSVIMGDLNKQSILDVWYGDRFKTYRKAHLDKKRTSMPLCSRCYRHINWFNIETKL